MLNGANAVDKTDKHLPAVAKLKEKEKEIAYLALARKLAEDNAKQCPTINYHIHWIYSKNS